MVPVVENVGTVVKLNINVEPIDGQHLKDMKFSCAFYVSPSKKIILDKSEMIEYDEDNYIAIVDSSLIGAGEIKCRLEASISDPDCPDGWRKEIVTFSTRIKLER